MNEMFSQGGKGSTGILTNKQAIARKFGVKQNDVVYFSVGVDLGGYKVIYDKSTQRAYSLPVLPVGTTADSLNEHAILVHSAGTVDLGELAATRREFVSLSDSFATGLVVNTRNELLFHNGIGYTYLGSLPVTITAGTNPVGNADWKPQTDPKLRDDLASARGAALIGVSDGGTVQDFIDKDYYKRIGDIRGWGAKCDGSTDDYSAIQSAVNDTGGKIVIPANIFLSSIVEFNNLESPKVEFLNGSKLRIDTSFKFNAKHRAPLSFNKCSNPTVIDADITGAKLDKIGFSGVDPVNDGDAGIEYIDCTGVCSTIRPKIKDVKTWGVIHINVEGFYVLNPVVKNCQVQSGVGCAGSKWGIVENPRIEYAGLYGIELETVGSNKLTSIIGGGK